MPKKTKKNKNESKKSYFVVISRDRFKKDVKVVVQDDSLPYEHANLSIEICGITRENAPNDTHAFNLLHYAIAQALHERFPDSTEELNEYNDAFFRDIHNMSLFASEVLKGSSLSLSIPDLDSYTEYRFDGKNADKAWNEPREYFYEINGAEGKRTVSRKKQEGRPPVFLD